MPFQRFSVPVAVFVSVFFFSPAVGTFTAAGFLRNSSFIILPAASGLVGAKRRDCLVMSMAEMVKSRVVIDQLLISLLTSDYDIIGWRSEALTTKPVEEKGPDIPPTVCKGSCRWKEKLLF